jgi:hypothetical protein
VRRDRTDKLARSCQLGVCPVLSCPVLFSFSAAWGTTAREAAPQDPPKGTHLSTGGQNQLSVSGYRHHTRRASSGR